ncbi:MAG: RlmE family RNA methyltransferase [Phycisphaerae bacterium]|jgi:23S rRNA (uridine2552-2'-O)-methyltransferase|nr:RlmE family RNA methyltransferase [Phycisphaerae bacterium]
MSSQRVLHDHFFREAKRNGYRSRAAYKLTEIDDKRSILRKKDFVLDLGAAPGSWLQVASKRVGPRGKIIGVDLKEIDNLQLDNVTTIQEDVTELSLETFENEMFDVVLSDMAPSTTGNRTIDHHGSVRLCHTALDIAATLLKPKGNLVMKVLEGGAYKELLERCETCFSVAKGFKPKASRAISTEMFVVCTGRKEDMTKPMDIAPPRPGSGW